MPLTPGTLLGPYEIIEPISAGGMGEVYKARDSRLERRVAIKLLPASMAMDHEARVRLRLEALAAAALDHPYICKIFEIGEHGDALFLVMEFIPGDTLDRRLQDGPLAFAETLRVAGEIAEALETAHAARILHRDLKPANIMLTQQGHVKIMDFGLAKRVADSSPPAAGDVTARMEPQLTTPGTIIGTPDYMSPEQVQCLPLDVRSDQFSFGVILAEMIGGRHPFRRSTTIDTLMAVVREPPDIATDIPPGLAAVLRRLMAKNVEDRYPSIADLRADLGRLASTDLPVLPEPPAVFEKPHTSIAWKWPALLFLAIAIVGLGAYWFFRPVSHAIRSLAVLPLDNRSESGASQDFFAEGMTDELTSNLATISGLRVISRGSAMQFKGAHRPSATQIAKTLNIDAIVEGSVARSGDKVRINAQLIDALADKVLWSQKFERNSRDVLAMQDELASAIRQRDSHSTYPSRKVTAQERAQR